MKEEYCVVMTTFADRDAGQRIIDGLIRNRLAVCVQTMAIASHYRWKGELEKSDEILAIIKTKVSLYEQVEEFIVSRHDYECPEVVKLPITAGFVDYLSWIDAECG